MLFPNLRIGDDTFGSVSVAFFEKMDLLCRDIISKVLVEIGITPSLRELLDPFLPQNCRTMSYSPPSDKSALCIVSVFRLATLAQVSLITSIILIPFHPGIILTVFITITLLILILGY
jgi:hypothetical protein